MGTTSYEELTALERQNLRESMEKLKADASEIITYTHRLKGLHKHFDSVEANILKRSRELDLKEKELQSMSSDLDKKIKTFEAEKSKAGDLTKLVEECTEELRSKRNQLTARLDSLTRVQRELEFRNKQLGQVMAELKRRSDEARKVEERKRGMEEETARNTKDLALILDKIEESGKQLAAVDEQLESRQKLLEMRSLELVSREKMLGCVRESIELSNSDLKLKEKMVQSLKHLIADCDKTIDSKSEELGEIRKLIEQQTSELDVLRNQHDTIYQLVQVLSEELVAKEKTRKEILETICRSSSEMKERAKEIKAAEIEASDLNVRSERFRQDVERKEKELDLLKNQIESEGKKLIELKREMEEETYRKKKDLELVLSKVEESGKQLAAVDEQLESQRRLLEIQSVELVSKEMELGCVRDSIKLSISDLELKKKMVESENNRITVCGKTIDSKSKELGEIQKLIEKQTSDLGVMHNHCDSIRLFIEGLSEEIVAKEMELECVVESSKHFKFDIEVKEKRVQALNNLIKISAGQLDLKSKELGEIERELELKKRLRQMSTDLVKHEKQPAAAPINDTSQQNAAETEPVNEEALTHNRFAASLTRHEVATILRALPNPAEFVLEEVQELISEELDLQDSLLEILVLFFEELTEIQRSDDPQLQDKATQVATLWKGKITIVVPKSSLEALAFLLFIVAYGLKELINEEETALLASSIAHYEQAPNLFNSLCLNCEIRKFVEDLIKKSQYIPAVRLICLFNLNDEFSPTHFLEKEIINLRQSALERRPTESSQAREKDVGRLRAILELVADYNLKINLPGDLIAKLMIQRENSAPLVRCSVKHKTSSSNPQANSPNPASAQSSSVNLRVPKPEFKPYLK